MELSEYYHITSRATMEARAGFEPANDELHRSCTKTPHFTALHYLVLAA
jgi:hypothetical protein